MPSRDRGGATPILLVVLIMIGLLIAAVFLLTDGGGTGPMESSGGPRASHERELGAPDPIGVAEGAAKDAEATQRSAAESDVAAKGADAVPEEIEDPEVGTGVSGRVLGFDGLPAAGVTVSAEREVSLKDAARFSLTIPDGKQDTRFVRSVETDDDGRFAMADLIASGGYALRAESVDGGVGSRGDVLVVESLISDVGDIGLRRGARVRGRVRTETGGPVANASVDFSQFWNSRPVLSAADGSFDAGVLAPGRHQVRVEKGGWVLPNDISLEFIEGDVVDDLELVLVPGHAITGRVVDEGGRPVPRAWVTATRMNAERDMMMWFSMARPDRVRNDVDGRFAFDALLPGEYELSVSCPGYENGEVSGVTAGGPPVDIEMPRFATVIGVVVDASNGQPVTADELKLYWKPPWNDAGDESMQEFWSDTAAEIGEDGTFSLGVNQAGLFEVEARREGYAPGRSDRFDVEKGATRSGVVVRLVRGRTLGAMVTDALTRAPLPGAIVELRKAATRSSDGERFQVSSRGFVRGGGPSRGGLIERGVTGATGTVELRSIRNGDFDLFVRAPGYCEATVTGVVIQPGIEPAPVEVTMTPGGAIEGIVRDDRGGALPAYDVVVEGESGASAKAVSATGGRYLVEHLTPGRYKVEGDAPGLASPTPFMFFGGLESGKETEGYPIVVEEGGSATFDLTVSIDVPGALAGSILWNGRPADGLQVSASRIDDKKGGGGMGFDFGNMVKSDKLGGFEFRRLAPGRYRVTAGKSWQRMFAGGETTVQSNVTARLSIEIGVGGIRGRVLDASGAPIAGANVSSRGTTPSNDRSPFADWSSRRNARTAQDGTFELEELGAGRYTLTVRADGYRPVEPVEVDVQSQRVSGPIELRVVGGGWIRVFFESVAGGSRAIRLALESETGERVSQSWASAVTGETEWVDAGVLKRGRIVVETGNDLDAPSETIPFAFEMKDGENAEVRVRLN